MQDLPAGRGAGGPGSLKKFRTNGPVLGDNEVYIVRPADQLLYDLLGEGEYAYVVGPTQLGKTSLVLRALHRLSRHGHPRAPKGIRWAFLDLHGVGRSDDPKVWFHTVQKRILEELELSGNVPSVGPARTPAESWRRFLEVEIPARCEERVILCFDEIGYLLEVSDRIREDFLGVIRAVQATRKDRSPAFCFLGIVNPGELSSNANQAPFNVAKPVVLDDLTLHLAEEAFLEALGPVPGAREVFHRVYSWTNGHPFMTQRLCQAVVHYWSNPIDDTRPPRTPMDLVDSRVKDIFLKRGRFVEPVLVHAEQRLLALPEDLRVKALTLYGELLEKKAHEPRAGSPEQMALQLAGLVAWDDSGGPVRLRVRNRVFATVFDAEWVHERILELRRPFRDELTLWLKNGKHPDHTLRGDRLAEAEEAFKKLTPTAEEAELLAESLARARDGEKQIRLYQRLLILGLLCVVGLVVWSAVQLQLQNESDRRTLLEREEERRNFELLIAETRRASDEKMKELGDTVSAFSDAKRKATETLAIVQHKEKPSTEDLKSLNDQISAMDTQFTVMNRKAVDLQSQLAKLQVAPLPPLAPEQDLCTDRIQKAVRERDQICSAQRTALKREHESALDTAKSAVAAAASAATASEVDSCKKRIDQLAADGEKACHARVCAQQAEWDSQTPRKLEKCP